MVSIEVIVTSRDLKALIERKSCVIRNLSDICIEILESGPIPVVQIGLIAEEQSELVSTYEPG